MKVQLGDQLRPPPQQQLQPLNAQSLESIAPALVLTVTFVRMPQNVVIHGMFVCSINVMSQLQLHLVQTLENTVHMTGNVVTVVKHAGTTTAHTQLQLLHLPLLVQTLENTVHMTGNAVMA